MGRFRVLISLVLALVFALVGSSLIYKWMQGKEGKQVLQQKAEKQSVVVARTDLPWGTKLTGEQLKTASYMKDNVPEGSFPDLKSIQGRVLIAPVKRNEVILESKLAPDSVTRGGVAAVIDKGKRAIAVKGNKVLGLAGFIQPGDRVDVLVTMQDPEAPASEREITKTVLEDLLVLATGTQVEKKKGEKPAQVDVFTLEVTPQEAERLALAATHGTLHFALRNATDKDMVLTEGATVPVTLDAFRTPQQLMEPKLAAAEKTTAALRRTHSVECIRGSRVSKMEF